MVTSSAGEALGLLEVGVLSRGIQKLVHHVATGAEMVPYPGGC